MKKNQTSYPLSGQGGRKMDRQYRRVSTEEQEKGTSLESQLAKLAEVAPNAVDYCDAGYSGTNGDRPD
ncbi:MAG: recombinase family protein, partial [Chloroflexi bacterium]|nr:recombinase family protein [Chloroflexota bacterium]